MDTQLREEYAGSTKHSTQKRFDHISGERIFQKNITR